jgi:hypothetical protein
MATYEEVIQALRIADSQGNVEDARALAQIANSMRPQTAEAPVAPTEERTIPQEIGRQAGLAGRAIITGLSSPMTATGDFIQGAANLARIAAGKKPIQAPFLPTSQVQQEGLTGMGFPTPETTSERLAQVGMQGIASLPTMKPIIPNVGTSLVREVPAAMVAPMAAQPVAEQVYKLTDSDLAATIAGLGVGYVAGGAAGKAGGKYEQRGQPVLTMDEVRLKATRAYNKVEQAGIELNQQSSLNLLNDVKDSLNKARYLPEKDTDVKVVLSEFDRIVGRGNVSFGNVDQMRQIANDLKMSEKPNTQRLGRDMVSTIDSYISRLSPNDVTSGAGGVDETVKTIMQARKDWRNLSRASTLEDILNVADIKADNPNANLSDLIRQGFIRLASDSKKMSGFTPDEQNAIRSVSKGGDVDPLLNFVSKFDPTKRSILSVGNMIGAYNRPEIGVPLMIAGTGADVMQNFLRQRAAQKVSQGLLSGTIPKPQQNMGLTGLLSAAFNREKPQE